MLSNKLYNFLKYFTTVFLPGVGAIYWGLWEIFDFHRIINVNATINTIIAGLGLLLGYSSRKYNRKANAPDGDLYVAQDPVDGEKYLKLGVNNGIEDITSKDVVKLQVKHQDLD